MHGDYEDREPPRPPVGGFDWLGVLLGALFVAFAAVVYLASGCDARGSEPPRQAPPVQAPAVVRTAPAAPLQLLGWNFTQPDGTVVFVPVGQPTPPGAMTYPAPWPGIPGSTDCPPVG